ncbi:ABC transporter ATP-binding protein [Aquipuribacter nitratireducens]|uniref:ABC transporter ATP-binding protein n=1 Tax=Aquipuribacter nitratireducens TaxID=650104 RepID=UPI003A908E6C
MDLAVPVGQLLGVVGPSGGGKSTLLRAVVGVQERVSGRLSVLGRPAGDPALRRDIGYGPQSGAVYQDLTVRQNLAYAAAAAGIRRSGRAAAVDRALGEVDLGGLADRLVASLSGGQRSRVALAAAVLARPRLLVLDEPTVGLDPVLRRDLWAFFRALAADGTTLLVSSHVMDEAERCESLLLLREGRVVAHDTPEDLMSRTGTRDVGSAFLSLVEPDTP